MQRICALSSVIHPPQPFPGIVFMVFTLNFFVGREVVGRVPFGTMLRCSCCVGSRSPSSSSARTSVQAEGGELPVRINQIPRQVPEQVWYMQPTFSVIVGGVLPFGAVFIELFILSSIWLHQFYYVFGFLLLVFIILVITCAEITIVMCYFQLCAETTTGGGARSSRRAPPPGTCSPTRSSTSSRSSRSPSSSRRCCTSGTCRSPRSSSSCRRGRSASTRATSSSGRSSAIKVD